MKCFRNLINEIDGKPSNALTIILWEYDRERKKIFTDDRTIIKKQFKNRYMQCFA